MNRFRAWVYFALLSCGAIAVLDSIHHPVPLERLLGALLITAACSCMWVYR